MPYFGMIVSFPVCCPISMWSLVVYQFYCSSLLFCLALAVLTRGQWAVLEIASFVYSSVLENPAKLKLTQRKTYNTK